MAARKFKASLSYRVAMRRPALSAQQHLYTPVAIADTGFADRLDAGRQRDLVGSAGLVMVGGRVELQSRTGSADRHLPLATDHADALVTRLQIFRRIGGRQEIGPVDRF